MFATRSLRLAASATRRAASSSSPVAPLANRVRTSTDVTGVDVHPAPLKALNEVYTSTLSLLQTLPENSVYRQSAAAITQHRHSIIKDALAQQAGNEGDASRVEQIIQNVEAQLETPFIEDVIRQATAEKELAAKMLDWAPWEPLEHPPAPGQWSYFSMAEEAGEGEEDQHVDGNKN